MYNVKEVIRKQAAFFRSGLGQLIEITDAMDKAASDFADAYCEFHAGDLRSDNRRMWERAKCGILGEMAVCEALGFGWKAADTSIGEWNKYKVGDLKHLGIEGVGVKTSRLGNFPLVFRSTRESEVICVLGEKGNVWVAGVATPDVIAGGCDDAFVKDPHVSRKKSAFVDFKNLKKLEYLDYTLYKAAVRS